MCRVSTPAVIGGFLLGLLLGCGSPRTPEAVGSGEPIPKPGDPPKPIAKDEVPAKKTKLAELRAQIVGKEKELAALKSEADALDRLIRQSESSDQKVYTKPEDLLADMPKEAYPRTAADKGLERNAAKKWCEANLVGRVVEWTDVVKKPSVSSQEPYELIFPSESFGASGGSYTGQVFIGEFKLGDEPAAVILTYWGMATDTQSTGRPQQYRYSNCSLDEAKAMRVLEGKVTFRATISGPVVVDTGTYGPEKRLDGGLGEYKLRNAITLTINPPSINGHLPVALVPKPKK